VEIFKRAHARGSREMKKEKRGEGKEDTDAHISRKTNKKQTI
jgi:predicted transposase YdaD